MTAPKLMADSKGNVLVTGIAGFIGYHLARKLAEEGYTVFGVDNLNDYYSVDLKKDRLRDLGFSGDLNTTDWVSSGTANIRYRYLDLTDLDSTRSVFDEHEFNFVVHLAAQPGVRLSISRPDLYINANIIASYNLFEAIKHYPQTKLLVASSSSVYGKQEKTPYSETDQTDQPASLYAATKKSVEIIGHYYAAQYNLNISMLRLFTVYGPWGRPDMAVYGFFSRILNNEPISVYNHGNLRRDFTYVGDVVEVLARLLSKKSEETSSEGVFDIFNIGNESPILLDNFIGLIEKITEKKAERINLPMQDGDVYQTYADSNRVKSKLDITFHTPLEEGLRKFYRWYQDYHAKSSK